MEAWWGGPDNFLWGVSGQRRDCCGEGAGLPARSYPRVQGTCRAASRGRQRAGYRWAVQLRRAGYSPLDSGRLVRSPFFSSWVLLYSSRLQRGRERIERSWVLSARKTWRGCQPFDMSIVWS